MNEYNEQKRRELIMRLQKRLDPYRRVRPRVRPDCPRCVWGRHCGQVGEKELYTCLIPGRICFARDRRFHKGG